MADEKACQILPGNIIGVLVLLVKLLFFTNNNSMCLVHGFVFEPKCLPPGN